MLKFVGKKFDQIVSALKRKQKRFHTLSVAEQRVAIAKDVIEQVRARRIKPRSTYLNIPDALNAEYRDEDDDLLERDASIAMAMAPPCEVCGIGSLFVAAVTCADNFTVKDLNYIHEGGNNYCTRDAEAIHLAKWFDDEQLDIVEAYFERNYNASEYTRALSANERGPIWRSRTKSKRLVMIMENIISNRGKFDPAKGRHRIDA